jgi:hypothetical protein
MYQRDIPLSSVLANQVDGCQVLAFPMVLLDGEAIFEYRLFSDIDPTRLSFEIVSIGVQTHLAKQECAWLGLEEVENPKDCLWNCDL